MGRFLVIIGIWVTGFILGFGGYLAYPILSQIAVSVFPSIINLNIQITGALVAGVISSVITLMAVLIWAYTTRPSNVL